MDSKEKKSLSEIDICDLFITPAIRNAGWDAVRQIQREMTLTLGPIVVRGNLSSGNKKKKKFADYVLYWEPSVPVAVVEAKDNKHTPSHGLQQALGYAEILEVPSAFSSNGDAFASHNKTPWFFSLNQEKIMRLYSDYLKHSLLYVALFGISITINGCSFSESSKSISDSTSSIISSPSSISGESQKYQNEVADYTMAYVKSSQPDADYNTFLKGLNDIAAKQGITNWDQDLLTYRGIGKGLRKAKVEGIVFETYKKNFAGGNITKMEQIQDGYESAE